MSIMRVDETDLLIPLYDGVHEAPPWRVFLDRLRRRLRATQATITGHDGDEVADPWLLGLRSGRVYVADDRADDAAGYSRVVRANEPGGASAWLTVTRVDRDFSAADGALLVALTPHLAVALRTRMAIAHAAMRVTADQTALARAGVDWVALGRDARVLAGSHDGRASRPVGERLAPGRTEAAAAIAAFCLAPAAPVAVTLDGTALLLVRGDGQAAALGLFVSGRSQDGVAQAAVLAGIYGLTPSEARLATAVAGGASLTEAAVALGLTIETARNYSKRVFAKMRVRGQVDLVRAVAGSVAGLV